MQKVKGEGSLQLEFANCMGESKWKFIEAPNKFDSIKEDYQTIPQENSGRSTVFFMLPRKEPLYLYIEPDYLETVNKGETSIQRSDYMLRA